MQLSKQLKLSSPEEGQVEFRLLCKHYVIGGLKGTNGNIIKSLERETSSHIHVNLSHHDHKVRQHRVVHVIASYHRTSTVSIDGVVSKVSPAQQSLIRVFDRAVEVEASSQDFHGKGGSGGGGRVKCVLVVEAGMVGAVMGVGGERIDNIVKETGAFVQILPLDVPPPGANLDDQLVQITGGILPVKKALVVISEFLQQKIVFERGGLEATSSRFMDRSMKMDMNNPRVKYTANGGERAQVIFKLICPYEAAGFVIGVKGRNVRSIEEETGASIHFSVADAGNHVRVAIISAFENKESQYSLAQNATVRVFNELVSSEDEGAVTARLLILPYQYDLLTSGEVSIMSTIHDANGGVTLKFRELTYLPDGASADEKVLQIDGDYPDVQAALFEVTWILRERVFDASLPKDNLPLLPHKLLNMPSQENKISALTEKMNNCSVSKKSNGSLPPMFPHTQFSAGSSSTTGTGSSGDSAAANVDSNIASQSFTVTNTKLEIAVRKDIFDAVYGKNGNNLARLRKISGATVEVEDPSSGSDGKVIISGTRDQTIVAQSLLQAFIMSA